MDIGSALAGAGTFLGGTTSLAAAIYARMAHRQVVLNGTLERDSDNHDHTTLAHVVGAIHQATKYNRVRNHAVIEGLYRLGLGNAALLRANGIDVPDPIPPVFTPLDQDPPTDWPDFDGDGRPMIP